MRVSMHSVEATKTLYDRTATRWVRDRPLSLSDFTARQALVEMCKPLDAVNVLDVGCGEGYVSRSLKRAGAARLHGIDVSEGMIREAIAQEEREPLGVTYAVGDATRLEGIPDQSVDLVIAVFLYNYLDADGTAKSMSEIRRVMKDGARFIFAVPHPSFPFMRSPAPPFFFRTGGGGYFSARNSKFTGKIWKIDGNSLDVQLVHKTLDDYFAALAKAGFDRLPRTRELRVTKEHVELDPKFFGPIADMPLHLAMEIRR